MTVSRRQVLSGLGASLLGACCHQSPSILTIKRSPVLGRHGLLNMTGGTTEYDSRVPTADAHAHFFNATDMQAGSYLVGPVANEAGLSSDFRELIRFAGEVIDLIARLIAPSASAEFSHLRSLYPDLENLSNQDDRLRFLDDEIDDHDKEHSGKVFNALKRRGFVKEFDTYIERTAGKKAAGQFQLSGELIYKTVSDNRDEYDALVGELESGSIDIVREALALIEFIYQMLTYRLFNIRKFQKAFSVRSKLTRVDSVADVLVDFDKWLGRCEAYSRMQDQITLHSELARITGNFVVPIAAYNPWTAIEDGGEQLSMIETAIRSGGFRGVKIYPTVGYFPLGNSKPGVYPNVDFEHPNLEQLDTSLTKLFELCIECDVPVIAHGNHSMATLDEFYEMAGPKGWRHVVEAASLDGLKINVGHFGGDHVDESGNRWSKQFVDLMKRSEGLHGDLGFWDALADGERIGEFVRIANQPLGNGQRAADRIMYGSDWLMLLTDPDWRSYADRMYENLVGEIEADDIVKIFQSNVQLFYGAGRTGAEAIS